MGKYMTALLGQKPLVQELPKLTEPPVESPKDSFSSFDSTHTGRSQGKKGDGPEIDRLAGRLEAILRQCDNSKGMSPEAVQDLLAEGDEVYNKLPVAVRKAVFAKVDGKEVIV